jgi:hypothetical protein
VNVCIGSFGFIDVKYIDEDRRFSNAFVEFYFSILTKSTMTVCTISSAMLVDGYLC